MRLDKINKPHPILDSFRESFASVWNKKSLFFLLVLVQIAFFLSFFFVSLNYQTKILDRLKQVTDYLNEQQTTDVDIAKNILEQKEIFGEYPGSIIKNFKEIRYYFRIYLAVSFFIFLLFMSVSISVAYKILFNQFKKIFPKALLVSFSYLILIFLLLYSILNISMAELSSDSSRLLSKYIPFFALSIIIFYFMFISLGILKTTKLEEVLKKTLYLGINKAHYVLFAYFTILFFMALFLYLTIFFTERSVILTLISIVALLKAIAFGKIFLISLLEKLKS